MSSDVVDRIGAIRWEIFDARKQNLVSFGERDLYSADVLSIVGSDIVERSIKLSDNFSLTLVESHPDMRFEGTTTSRNAQEGYGFGLIVRQDDIPTFSWDWFEIDGPGHAVMLPESFELSVETSVVNECAEIRYMELLTDIQFCVTEMLMHEVAKPLWRVVVFKGSRIFWPNSVP